MGAASTFGRNELGINSPTHRNTHAEEDLFSTSDDIAPTDNKANVLDDIFKTCPNPVPGASNDSNTAKVASDDFFNPREEENQEFGDFASAFASNNASANASGVAAVPNSTTTKKEDFADFTAAFDASTTNPTSDPTSLLFGAHTNQQLLSSPVAPAPTANIQEVSDLLSDLDGLNINNPAPSGEYNKIKFFNTIQFGKVLLAYITLAFGPSET